MGDEEAIVLAFNAGCDARLLGLPMGRNPYPAAGAVRPYRSWARGWLDVHQYWGSDVRGRWRFCPLTYIRGCR